MAGSVASWFLCARHVTAADALADLDRDLRDASTKLCFIELKGPVKDKLKRFGIFGQIGEPSFFPTISAAIGANLERHKVDCHLDDGEARVRLDASVIILQRDDAEFRRDPAERHE